MSKLTVKIHGQVLTELQLQPGQEYFAGRGSNCAIQLSHERGISRQHLKFFQQNNSWCVQLISKYGGMIYDGQTVDQVMLTGETQFTVPPYEFYFSDKIASDSPEVIAKNASTITQNPGPINEGNPQSENVLSTSKANLSQSIGQSQMEANLDATSPGISKLVAYLRIHNNTTRIEEVFKLEGHLWTAGRHPSCEIVINDSAISRKHFDISCNEEGYFVTDHGSSNGTKLNGEKIEMQKPQKLASGDVITIRNIEVTFEIHDTQYQNQLQVIESTPQNYASDMVDEAQAVFLPQEQMLLEGSSGPAEPAVLKMPPSSFRDKFKPTPIHIVIGVLALVFIFLLFSGTDKKTKDKAEVASTGPDTANKPKPIEELSAEKQKEVIDIFSLAKTYYVQRKYLLCISQTEKLHSLVAFYSNSKEIQTLCEQGRDFEQIELDRQRKEEARIEAENRIRKTVEECRAKVTPATTSAEIDICLQPAIELNPQDGLILDLQNLVKVQENSTQEKLEKEAQRLKLIQSGKSLFATGISSYKTGQLKLALKQLNDFINGNYGLNDELAEARRTLAAINKTLDQKLSEQLTLCQSAFEKADLKETILACEQVLKESPNNEIAKSNKEKAFSQLKREMKNMYEDSSLEESMGNIELAKEKWQKILDTSLPEDDYYKKAKQKLKKYGIGM